jgi:dethiobiotin synthetase
MTFGKLKYRGVFVTATEAGAGKTMLAAGLLGILRQEGVNVGVMKPVASGAIECDSGKRISQDVEMLIDFSGADDPWELINPYCLATPVTPVLAAKIEGVNIDLARIRACFEAISARHEFVVVEGADGLLSPLADGLVVADLIHVLDLPVIIVSPPDQGTINHTLLTMECLKNRQLTALGFFFNRFPGSPNLVESTNAEVVTSVSGVPHLGSLPELGDFYSQQQVIEAFQRAIPKERLREVLCELD